MIKESIISLRMKMIMILLIMIMIVILLLKMMIMIIILSTMMISIMILKIMNNFLGEVNLLSVNFRIFYKFRRGCFIFYNFVGEVV